MTVWKLGVVGNSELGFTTYLVDVANNIPPATPTALSPSGSAEISRNEIQRFSWSSFSDPDGDVPQSALEIRYRRTIDAEWSYIFAQQSTDYYDVSTETFKFGDYEWQVRVYDAKTSPPSEWSASAFFVSLGFFNEPEIKVEVAWTDNYAEPFPVWTDITGYVEGISTKMGRTREINAIETGTFDIELNNSGGEFTPLRGDSPFYPNVIPMRQIRVTATDDTGAFYEIARGTIESWPINYEGLASRVTVTATDWLDFLASVPLTAGFPSQSLDARVNAALDQALWPAELRDVNPSTHILEANVLEDNQKVLEAARKYATPTLSIVYVDGGGRVVFEDRSIRDGSDVRWVFSESVGTGIESGLSFSVDGQDIVNSITLKNAGRIEELFEDSESIAQFGKRSATLELNLTDDEAARSLARRRLAMYSKPFLRVSAVRLNPAAASDGQLWPVVLDVAISDKIRLASLPDTAPAPELIQFVESVSHEIVRDGNRLQWITTLDVSRDSELTGWTLGVAGSSDLGDTTFIYV